MEINDWKDLELTAKNNMNFNGKNILLEVAAQHPLINGIFPSEEFEYRLKKGLDIYEDLHDKYNIKFFLPGSLHKGDLTSLTGAASQWLYNHCVSSIDILPWSGEIYNSIDECQVGSELFFKNKFDRLISICSPAQLHRKALAYIKYGVYPEMISIPFKNMFHSYIDEIFLYIPDFLNDGKLNKTNAESRKID